MRAHRTRRTAGTVTALGMLAALALLAGGTATAQTNPPTPTPGPGPAAGPQPGPGAGPTAPKPGAQGAAAKKKEKKPTGAQVLESTGVKPGELAAPNPATVMTPKAWHPSCSNTLRKPVSLVVGYDAFRDYRPANRDEGFQTRKLLGSLCQGDRVLLVEVGPTARPIAESWEMKQPTDVDQLAGLVETRREPKQYLRVNAGLTQLAADEWSRPEVKNKGEDVSRVIVFFTKDLESRESKKNPTGDFAWTKPPFWLEGMATVAIIRPLTSSNSVEAWETFVITTPKGLKKEAIPQGLRVDLGEILDPTRLKPKPAEVAKKEDPKAAKKISYGNLKIPIPDLPDLWPLPDGVILWNDEWTPWAIASGLGLLLVIVLFWALARSAPTRAAAAPFGESKELTFIIHDRLHGTVVGQEKAKLETAVRLGPSVTSDVIIPGPFALEILPGSQGAVPRIRSMNTLPVEVQRAQGGRMLHATDSVPVPLRSGDRVQLGGGHELEIRYAS